MTWLYGIQSGLFTKIGCANNIPARLKTMNLYNPHPCKVVIRRQLFDYAYAVEKRMHRVLTPYSIGREWFMVDAKLIRAALSIVIREVEADRFAWKMECIRKEQEREARKSARVLDVVLPVDKN